MSMTGALRDMLSLSARLSSTLVSRVKVMAQLDIAKKRVPQDGRFSLNLGQRAVYTKAHSKAVFIWLDVNIRSACFNRFLQNTIN